MNNIISKTILFYFLVVFNLVSKNKEIEITATSMEWKKEESIAIATGDAKAIRGTTILYANKIIVFLTKKKILIQLKSLMLQEMLSLLEKIKLLLAIMLYTLLKMKKFLLKVMLLCKEKIV